MANDLTFTQMATVLNELVSQATGESDLVATDYTSFITVAQTALKTGYDPLNTAISQMLTRTIFSRRPYTAKFKGLRKTNQQFGNHIRKIQIIDKDLVDTKRFNLVDNQSIDQYIVRKPEALQTNYYGASEFADWVTIYDRQLDCAFTTPEELAQFFALVIGNISDKLEQARETADRATVTNFIAGKIQGDPDNVIHMVTEYNEASGLSLTSQTVLQPDNFRTFMPWAYSRIAYLCSLLTERSLKYHINITGKPIMRHTPYDRMKCYMYAPLEYQTRTGILTDMFNDKYMKLIDHELVNYWQSIDTPDKIQVTPAYIGEDGAVASSTEVTKENIFGVIFDDEAIGITEVGRKVSKTPYNAAGEYTNQWYRMTQRYWNDTTENGIVLLLD